MGAKHSDSLHILKLTCIECTLQRAVISYHIMEL